MKPALVLSKSEKLFWPILTKAQSFPWGDSENMMASILCRDLATVDEISGGDIGDELLPDICKRIYEGVKLLKLNDVTGNTRQYKIFQLIYTGV